MKRRTKTFLKKQIAFVLCILIAMCSFSVTGFATSKSQTDALNWVKSQVGKGLDYDGVYGNQCVDLIKYYYSYLGVSAVTGNGCDYAWNSLPSGWTRVQGGTPQPGDILVYSGNSSNSAGHVAIYESDRSHYHQNFNGHSYVEKVTYMYNGLSNPYWGYIRPNWSSGGSSASSFFTSVSVDGIGTTDATLRATTNLTYVQRTGFYIGTSTTNMTRGIEDTYANVLNIWFTMSDCGVTLQPGTTYYYKIFIIVDGQEYCTEVKSFKTQSVNYTVKFNANGGSVSPSSTSVTSGSAVNLPTPSKYYTITYNANGGSGAPASQAAYVTCKGWSTSSSATSATYSCGTSYKPASNVTLYAVWNSFANKNLSSQTPTRDGYKFLGWSENSSATSATFDAGENVNVSGNAVLYAVWEKIQTPTQKPTVTEENLSLNYKDSVTFNVPVTLETSNAKVASVSEDTIRAVGTGIADVTVTYEDGSQCIYHIDVSYNWLQWIIVILLFGWIWY